MSVEVIVAVVAVFLAGGAVGAAGTLMAQWFVRKLGSGGDVRPPPSVGERELSMLRADVGEMSRQIRNLDARLDFQEQLLGGATPLSQPPPRLPPTEHGTDGDL